MEPASENLEILSQRKRQRLNSKSDSQDTETGNISKTKSTNNFINLDDKLSKYASIFE